jgi:hypothetical protein
MGAAFVQKAVQQTGTSAAAQSKAFPGNVTAGDLLVVVVATFGTGITVTVSDNLNGSYTQGDTYVVNVTCRLSLWFFPNSAGGACTVTVTPSGSCQISMALHEYSGLALSSVLNSTITNTGGVTTTPTTGTCTAAANELVVGAVANDTAVEATQTVNSPFTIRNLADGSVADALATADDVAAAGSEGATFNWSAGAAFCGIAASFKLPTAVAPSSVIQEQHQGPPMRGSPWLQQLPLTDGLRSTASVIAWIQTTADNGGGVASFLQNVTSGNFIEATFLTLTPAGSPGPTLRVTDSLGQTYRQAGPYVTGRAGNNVGTLSKWYVPQTLAGACTVTATPSFSVIGGNAFGSVAIEYRTPALLSVDSTVQGDGTASIISGNSSVIVGPVLVTGAGADLVTAAVAGGPLASIFSLTPPFQFRLQADAQLVVADDVSAFATESATFTQDRGVFTGPTLGVAYRFGTPPGQPQTKFETFEGPPMRGAPWVVKIVPTEDSWTVQAPPPIVAPPPFDIELHGGPPIRGAPWQQHLPIEDALVVGLRFPKPPTPPPTPGKGAAKPFIERWPDVSDPRRLGRITDKISSMINSLAGQALIQKTGPSSFLLRASAIQLARAPTAADDVTTGATVGTVWINTVTQQLWICVANAQGAAVWRGPI